jgi:hypothetical protein
MTADAFAAEAAYAPGPQTPVLANRPLRPGTDPSGLSRFGDDRWKLSPAIFEDNAETVSLNHALVSPQFRSFSKLYCWLELNYDGELTILRRASINGRQSVRTMLSTYRNMRVFLEWAEQRQITSLDQVTSADLDDYLHAVRRADFSHGHKSDLLQAVRRIWAFRDLLPAQWRLPPEPCWKGKDSRVLLGRAERPLENRIQRIDEEAMTSLLAWAMRFVEDFSKDIIAALGEFRPLFGMKPGCGRDRVIPESRRARTPGAGGLRRELNELVNDFRARGEALPGRLLPDGTREPDWPHLARFLDCNYLNLQVYRDLVDASGVPVADDVYLRTKPTASLDGSLWMSRFRYHDMFQLVRQLYTACIIVIAYLSGMRPGEVLTLRRGCVSRNEVTGLWQVTGREWKGVVDARGAKIAQGKVRQDPWIVVEPVVRALGVVEQLHASELLFPVWILVRGPGRPGARSYNSVNRDLDHFVAWVNQYCADNGRTDTISDAVGHLTMSRFRRTLAWFICRRPRGLVAAAIQYGHVKVQITQGYGGTYASGFPDDLAFETWLAKLDELDAADQRLRRGERVSGPAAEAYRARVIGGSARFAGRVVRSGRQARHILANPSLQIYSGKGMTCVFNAVTALCQLTTSGEDPAQTPDTDDCKASCRNIARTDADVNSVRLEAEQLRRIVDDGASPPIRLARERARLEYLERIISHHQDPP